MRASLNDSRHSAMEAGHKQADHTWWSKDLHCGLFKCSPLLYQAKAGHLPFGSWSDWEGLRQTRTISDCDKHCYIIRGMYQCQFISSESYRKDQWNQEHHRVWCLASSLRACPVVPEADRKHHRQKRLLVEWQALIKHSKAAPEEKRSEWTASHA